MIRNKNFKTTLLALFSSLYIFAFIFAANIHNHDGGYFYKDFNFKNSSSTFSKQNKVNNADECLSCHFASAPVILPNSVKISFSKEHYFNAIEVLLYQKEFLSNKHTFFLRGPPTII